MSRSTSIVGVSTNQSGKKTKRAGGANHPAANQKRAALIAAIAPIWENLENRTLLSAGQLDPTFGAGGLLTTDFGPATTQDEANAIAQQSTGKIIVAGKSDNGTDSSVALERLNADGSLDTSFGTGGKVTTSLTGYTGLVATAVTVGTNDEIYVAGYGTKGSSKDFVVLDYNATGTLQHSNSIDFKIGGTSRDDIAYAIALDVSGHVIVAGQTATGSQSNKVDFAVARLNASNLALDTTFNTAGSTPGLLNIDFTKAETAHGVLVDGNNIVVAGESGGDFAVARVSSTGTLDASFGTAGKVVTDIGSSADVAYTVARDSSGRYLVAGIGGTSGADFAMVRYNSNGTLDTSFNATGKVVTDFAGGFDQINAVAVQANGDIVAAGQVTATGGTAEVGIARYTAAGTLDTAGFTDGASQVGIVGTAIGSGDASAQAVAIGPNGRILVAGTASPTTRNEDFVVARFQSNNAPTISVSTVHLTGITELATTGNQPVANGGDLVSSLISQSGLNFSDLDAGAGQGIAVTAADNTHGQWYSFDGTNWTAMGSPSETAALLLSPAMRVQFVPNQYFNTDTDGHPTSSGTKPTISFKAWDQTVGTAGNTYNTSVPDGNNAFSANTATADITITSVNQPPVLTLPATQTTLEDTAHYITGLSVSDVDAGTSSITVTLAVTHGTLTINPGVTGGLTAAGIVYSNSNRTVTLSGDQALIRATLADGTGLKYTPDTNTNDTIDGGADTLTVSANDNGHTGTIGGAQTVTGTVAIDITPVNDAPVRTDTTDAGHAVTVLPGQNVPLDLDTLAYATGPASATDEAVQTLSVHVTGLPTALGTVTLANGTAVDTSTAYSIADLQGMKFVAKPDAPVGSASFTFNIQDTGGTDNFGVDTLQQSMTVTVAAQATDVYVANTWNIDTNVGPSTLSQGDTVSGPSLSNLTFGQTAFTDIQAAINAVATNGTVHVLAGTYAQALTVSKPISLLGPNAGIAGNATRVAEAILQTAVNAPETGVVLAVISSNVVIDGLKFDGNNTALSGGALVGGVYVNAGYGINVGNSVGGASGSFDHERIQNNVFQNFVYQGVYAGNTFGANYSSNYIVNNKFDNMKEGVQTYALHAQINDNVMTHVIRGVSVHGTNTAPDIGFTDQISGNTITLSDWTPTIGSNSDTGRGVGIWLNYWRENAAPMTVSNNTIAMTAAAPTGKTWFGIYGVSIDGSRTVNFNANTINGGGYASLGYYFSGLNTPNVTINGGTISGTTEAGIKASNWDAQWGGQITDFVRATINGVSISPTSGAGVLVYADPAHASTAQLSLTGTTRITGGATGILVDGTGASIGGGTLNSTVFSGQTGNYITLANGAYANQELDATTASFDGKTGLAMTLDQRFDAENKIFDRLNDDTLGFVRIKTGEVDVSFLDHSIQRGINAASANDTVNVQAGTFAENLIIAKAGITLAGAGQSGSGATRIIPAAAGAGGSSTFETGSSIIILVQANNFTVHDVLVDGNNATLSGSGVHTVNGVAIAAQDGIVTDYRTGIAYANFTVHNTTVQNIYLRGIYAGDGGTFNIHDNTVSNVMGDPSSIAIFNYAGAGFFSNNIVSYANDGIAANHSRGTIFQSNTISHSGSGIHTDNTHDGGTVVRDDLIDGNTVTDGTAGSYGIFVFVPYADVTVSNNRITDADYGLTAAGGQGGTVNFANNTVNFTSARAGSVGAYVSTTTWYWGEMNVSAKFTGTNSISNAADGVVIEQNTTSTHAIVTASLNGLALTNNTTGIEIHGGTVTLDTNSIIGGTTGLVIDNNTTFTDYSVSSPTAQTVATISKLVGDSLGSLAFSGQTVKYITLANGAYGGTTPSVLDATGAKFGGVQAGNSLTAADAWPIEDKITHYIDNASLGFVRLNATNVYVTANGGSIQRGVNMSTTGHTVNVKDGDYVEQVDINGKAITLLGQSETGTFIHSPATLTSTFTSTYIFKPVITVRNTTATIQNLTIDGAGLGTANNRFTGLAFYNAGGLADHLTVTGMRDNPLSGVQHGYGIIAREDDSAVRSLTISNSTVSDYQKNGIDVRGSGLTAIITANTVTGAGATGTIAQNGIVAIGVKATISQNVVSANQYTGANQATGILIMNGIDGTTVTSNVLEGNDVAVYVADSNVAVNDNSLAHSGVAGISHDGTGQVNATANWWGSANGPGIASNDFAANHGGGGASIVGANITVVPWLTQGDQDLSLIGFQAGSLDTTPPTVSTPTLDVSTNSGSTTDTITNFNGTPGKQPIFNITAGDDVGTAGSNVSVQVFDGDPASTGNSLGFASYSGGHWVLNDSVTLSDGPHSIHARVTDQSGNAVVSSALTIYIDTSKPTITSTPVASGTEATAFTLTGTYTDPDGTNAGAYTRGWHLKSSENGQTVADQTGDVLSFTPDKYGTYVFTYTVTDAAGNSSSQDTTINVANVAPVVTAAEKQTATEGAVHTFNLGSFADAGTRDGAWTVAVDWGDGSGTETFSVNTQGALPTLDHTYAEEKGDYTVSVTVTDSGGFASQPKTFAVTANDAALHATPITSLTGTEGSPFSGVVATFTDDDPKGTAADYAATITWENGRSTPGTVAYDSVNHVFTVSGDYTYGEQGIYSPSITITDASATGSGVTPASVTTSSTITVADAKITATAVAVSATESKAVTHVLVATFTDADPNGTASDYTAAIDWGDGGATSSYSVVANGNHFEVWADKAAAYAEEGTYTVTTTVTDASVTNSGVPASVDSVSSTATVQDAPIHASAVTVQAVEGAAVSNVLVATFTDEDPNALSSDYSVSVNWGDSTSSTGSVSWNASASRFEVHATKPSAYVEEGTQAITVSIADTGAHHVGTLTGVTLSSGTANSTANIADAALTAGALTAPQPVEGQAITDAQLFHFTDANPNGTADDFTATITWGDGTTSTVSSTYSSVGQIVHNANGGFDVLGSHTYAEEATGLSFSVAVVDTTATANSGTVSINVADPAVIATGGFGFAATEGNASTSQTVATFTDPGVAELTNGQPTTGEYTASINWGDGTSNSGAISWDGSKFVVSGTHTYAEEGTHSITTTISHGSAPDASAVSTATIADAPLTGSTTAVAAGVEGSANSSVLSGATFTDANPGDHTSEFSASINWGDGTTASAGTISYNSGTGTYSVAGLHTYAEEGSYPISIAISDNGTSTTTLTGTATVADASLTANGVDVTGDQGAMLSGKSVATFTDNGGAEALSEYSATINWGDGTTASNGTISYDSGTHTFTVKGDHTYVEKNTYTITTTIKHGTASDAVVTSTATIANVAPVVTAAANQSGDESTAKDFDLGSFSDAGIHDGPWHVLVNWGDNTNNPFDVTTQGALGSLSHNFVDNGSYTVTVSVTDKNGGVGSASFNAAIANVAPSNVNVSATGPINENGSTTLTGTFVDPGTADSHTVTIDWGDGSASTVLNLGAGVTTIPGTAHQYLNNQANDVAYPISVTVAEASGNASDNGAFATGTASVVVNNVTPSNLGLTLSSPTINENGSTNLSGTFVDPGTEDTHTVSIDWGDGTAQNPDIETISLGAGVLSFDSSSHKYLDNGTYTVKATVTDSDGASTNKSIIETVNNVAPSDLHLSLTATTINENGSTTLSGTFADPGTLDTHTVLVDWGDGQTYTINLAANALGFTAPVHTYADNKTGNAPYTINVIVTDKDTAAVTGSASVTVNNVAPTVSITNKISTSPEGTSIALDASATDASPVDQAGLTYSWTVTPNNGQAYTVSGANTAHFSFVPKNDGTFTVAVTVTDNDGVTATDSNVITVTDVAPTATLSGAGSVNEGNVYTLTIGPVVDPGQAGGDTVSAYTVLWGDGQYTTVSAADLMLTNRQLTHTYDNGTVLPGGTSPLTHISLTLYDNSGTLVHPNAGSLNILVNNVAPTATLFDLGGGAVEGQAGVVGFINAFDPSHADTTATFHYAWDFNNDGIFDSGDGTYAGSASTDSSAVPASYLNTPGSHTIRGRIIDQNNGFTDTTTTITVTNAAPTINLPTTATAGVNSPFTLAGTVTDPGSDINFTTATVDYGDGTGSHGLAINPDGSFTLAHTFTTANTFNATVTVHDTNGGTSSRTVAISAIANSFEVASVSPLFSGFDLTFNRPLDVSSLKFFAASTTFIPNVTLTGQHVGAVRGSLVWDTATNTLHFVKTQEATGALSASGGYARSSGFLTADTYTITLDGNSNALKDANGHKLDGNADGTDGGNFSYSFTVGAYTGPVVSAPDFARAPGEVVNTLADGTAGDGAVTAVGLPIRISNGAGVHHVDFVFNYDPSLLSVTGIHATKLNWSVTYNVVAPGKINVTAFSTDNSSLTASAVGANVVLIDATVAGSAAYGAAGLVKISNVVVNETAAQGDESIVKAALLGDATGDGSLSSSDASLLARITVKNDAALAAYGLTDPRIVGDVTGDGTISGYDADYVSTATVAMNASQIPAQIPQIYYANNASTGLDPTLNVPSGVIAVRGGTVSVPVTITDDARGLTAADLGFTYDSTRVHLSSLSAIQINSALPTGWTIGAINLNDAIGAVRISMYTSGDAISGNGPLVLNLLNLLFSVNSDAPAGVSPVTIDQSGHPAHTRLNEGKLVLSAESGSIIVNIGVTETGPSTDAEGTSVTYTSATVGQSGTASYAWTVTKDGQAYDLSGVTTNASTFTFTPNDNGNYAVALNVTDTAGNSGSASQTLTVSNVAPTPTIAGTQTSGLEGTQISLSGSANDPSSVDQASLTYAWSVQKIHGTTTTDNFASGTGTSLNFTPDDDGTYTVTFTATDKDHASTSVTRVITVANVAPTVSLTNVPTAGSEGTLTGTIGSIVNDPSSVDNGSAFTYAWTVTQVHNGVTTNGFATGSTSSFSFTPNDEGTYTVSLTVTDKDGGSTTYSAPSFSVAGVAPIATIGNTGPVNEPGTVTVSLSGAYDPSSADTTAGLHYSFSLTQAGLAGTYAGASATASDAFSFSDNGTYTVHGRVIDKDGLFSDYTTTVTVNNVAPTVSATNATVTVDEGSTASNTGLWHAIGANDVVTLTASVGQIVQNLNGTWSWSFGTHQGPQDNQTVTITAADAEGGTSTTTFGLVVNNVAPTVTLNGPNSANEGDTKSYTFTTSDPSSIDTFSVVSKSPSGGSVGTISNYSFNSVTGAGSFDVTFADNLSADTVSLQVQDSNGAVSNLATINVAVANVAPTVSIDSISSPRQEGTAITASASTADVGINDNPTLAWAVYQGSSTTAYASGTGATPSFTPDRSGDYTLKVIATDKDGASSTASQTITVANVAPTVTLNGSATASEGGTNHYTFSIADPGTPDTFTLVSNPGGSVGTISNYTFNATTRSGSFDVTFANTAASSVVSIQFTDSDNANSNLASIDVAVANVAPQNVTITAAAGNVYSEGSSLSFTGSATDPGQNDTLSYAWTVTKDSLAYDLTGVTTNTSTFGFTPSDDGAYVVTLTVTDADGASTSISFSHAVANVAPTVAANSTAVTTNEGAQVSNTGTWSDVLADKANVTLTASTGTVTRNSDGTWNWNYTPNDNAGQPSTVTITANDGETSNNIGSVTFNLTVNNVAPTATVPTDLNTVEATAVTVTATGSDASSVDAGSLHYFFSTDASIRNAATYAITGTANSQAFTFNNTGSYTVYARVLDKDGGTSDYQTIVHVANTAPTPSITGIPAGGTIAEETPIALGSTTGEINPTDTFTYLWTVTSTNGQTIADGTDAGFSFTPLGPGNYTVTLKVTDRDGASGTTSTTITATPTAFQVTGVTPNASGFDLHFNRPVNPAIVHLYDGQNTAGQLINLVVMNSASQVVNGSLVFSAGGLTASWVATGAALATDTYGYTLKSDPTSGFYDAGLYGTAGQMLAGTSGTGLAGSFGVVNSGAVVSLPDFARGPGQVVNVSNTDTGLPISISNANGVASVDLVLKYDPTLMTVSSVSNVASGWSIGVSAIDPVAGTVTIHASGSAIVGNAAVKLFSITAEVQPVGYTYAGYGKAQVLAFTSLVVKDLSGAVMNAVADEAVAKVAYIGDATGSGDYSAMDASLIARVVVGLDSGFDAYRTTDPVVVGDVTADGTLSGYDAAFVARKTAGLATPQIPDLPVGHLTFGPGATIDPIVTVGTVTARPGGLANIPISIDTTAGLLQAADFTFTYNRGLLTMGNSDISLGSVPAGWAIVTNVVDSSGLVRVSMYNINPLASGSGTLLNLAAHVSASATSGTSTPVNIATGPTPSRLNEGQLIMTPANGQVNILQPAVVGRFVAYNNSMFDGNSAGASSTDGNAIATDKQAFFAGQAATFANYTSYSRGINEIIVDLSNLPANYTVSASDFAFKMYNNIKGVWESAPAPTSVTPFVTGTSARVEIIWADGAIKNTWLQTTVKAAGLGLATDDTFYFGNVIGETGNSPADTLVNQTDISRIQGNLTARGGSASLVNVYDVNRDGLVNSSDVSLVQGNFTPRNGALQLITAPTAPAAPQPLAAIPSALIAPSPSVSTVIAVKSTALAVVNSTKATGGLAFSSHSVGGLGSSQMRLHRLPATPVFSNKPIGGELNTWRTKLEADKAEVLKALFVRKH